MKLYVFILIFIFMCNFNNLSAKSNSKNSVIDDITDFKELKKVFRTKNNVLVLFVPGIKDTQSTIKVFRDAADLIKGQGTMVLLDCMNSEVKKICKKMKITPNPFIIKHYKDGDFHKDYDRQIIVTSIVNFMRDPTGDLPWEEDPTGVDVYHIPDAVTLGKYLKKEVKPVLVMFYAPWCGFCKTLKPEYSGAATELKPKYVLAAIDVNRPENAVIRKLYNITGFPTLLYYEGGRMKHTFEGENNKAGIMAFMENPSERPVMKNKDPDWASEANSEIVHLTETNFEPVLKDEKSALVMFYAPWCGHCKRMKPEYEKAAEIMRKENIPGVLTALDATKESAIGTKFGVKGYPTVKYFVNGEFKFDVNIRDSDKIITFMQNPAEPPPPPPPETAWDEQESHVVHLTDETFKPFMKKKKHVLVMFYAPWCGHCKKLKPDFTKAADEFSEDPKVELAAVDCTKYSGVCAQYEVQGYPTLKYMSYLKDVRDYTGGRTAKDIINFLKAPEAQEVSNQAKVPVPFGVYPGSNDVLILTESTFEEALKSNKKILIMFYAPWCGHCTNMKPAFAEAAQALKKSGGGILAAVDCTVNMKIQEKYKINGFPTIKYFENGEFKKDFDGKRTTESIIAFVTQGGNLKKEEL